MIKAIGTVLFFSCVLAVLAVPARAECFLQEIVRSNLNGVIVSVEGIQRSVLPETDDTQVCIVEFDALVDASWHHGVGVHSFGNGTSKERACRIAIQQGKQAVLERLFPQEVHSEDVLICDENRDEAKFTGLEGLTPNNAHPSFYYQGTPCRWYLETTTSGSDLFQWSLILCELKPNKWTLVDRFLH